MQFYISQHFAHDKRSDSHCVLFFLCTRKIYAHCEQCILNFSERELTFMFAVCCRPSVCLSSVCSL